MAPSRRIDIFANTHKALRHFICHTLTLLSHLDVNDSSELTASLTQLDGVLDACRDHVDRENRLVHPVIEAHRSWATSPFVSEHDDHLFAVAAMRAESAALRRTPSPEAARRLYGRFAAFAGHQFEHMALEESRLNAALWAAYSDDQLQMLLSRILNDMTPTEMCRLLRWMVPALAPTERAEVIRTLPLAIQEQVLATMSELLSTSAWVRLYRELGQPLLPGLIAA